MIDIPMTNAEMRAACTEFFELLTKSLEDTYEVVESDSHRFSRYLVPKGTRDEITWYNKPKKSFRMSDHWNWYASVRKCINEHYIQCLSVDMPHAKKRLEEGKASGPIWGISVQVVGADGKYHVVYGERYDKKTRKWSWFEPGLRYAWNLINDSAGV